MSKKKAGSYNTPKMKSTDLLPQVFDTEVNRNWLDSTLDQMISKGNLTSVEGFIGDKSGKNRNYNDVYSSNSDLQPAITVRNSNKKLTSAITSDDIANAINVNLAEYNYNAAYKSTKHAYYPPIDIHKFNNYDNYAWIDQMPTYESVRTLTDATVISNNPGIQTVATLTMAPPADGTYVILDNGIDSPTKHKWISSTNSWEPAGATDVLYTNNTNNSGFTTTVDPITTATNQVTYTVTDNNNTFELMDGMIIKFVGDGWSSDAQVYSYLVTGTGDNIKLVPTHNWTTNTSVLPDITKTTVTAGGIWDETTATLVNPNKISKIWTASNKTIPSDMVAFYNTDLNRLPVFDGFEFTSAESNKTQFVVGDLIAFGKGWDQPSLAQEEYYKLYYTDRDATTGNITINVLIDAVITATGIKQSLATGLSEKTLSLYKDRLVGYDFLTWDKSTTITSEKDYMVTGTDSVFKTAWSRNNKWVSVDTLSKLNELVYGGVRLDTLLNVNNIAKRPIIEFPGNMNIYNFAEYNPSLGDDTWIGEIDYAVKPMWHYIPRDNNGELSLDLDKIKLVIGDTLMFTEGVYTKLYKVSATKSYNPVTEVWENVLEEYVDLINGHTAFVRNALPDAIDTLWMNSDIFWDGAKWSKGQQRTTLNQMPLYELYTADGTSLRSVFGSNFKGSRVFNYKVGTGIPDPEMGAPLTYVDVNGIGEYQFENYILTERFNQSVSSFFGDTVNQYREIPGQYKFKNKGVLSSVYKQSENPTGAETLITTDVTDTSTDIVINTGHASWRATRELFLHQDSGNNVLTESHNGYYNNKTDVTHNTIYVGKNGPSLKIHNLLTDSGLTFRTTQGVDMIATPQPGVTITSNSGVYEIEFTTYADKIFINEIDRSIEGRYTIVPIDNQDSMYHRVEINGKFLSANNYTINENNITIPKELCKLNDIVDVRYYSTDNENLTTNVSIPDSLKHNANNKLLTTFTLSETVSHWKSLIESTPGFEGNVYGVNNYNQVSKDKVYGGEIFIHSDLSLVHDALYATSDINITDALATAGTEYDNFIKRFRSQSARLYGIGSYTSVKKLVDDTLSAIIVNRKGSKLYATSNMVYCEKAFAKTVIIEDISSLPIITLAENFNSDTNIQDHVYVYLTDNVDTGGKFVTRLLTKNVDYTQSGNVITFLYQPIKLGLQKPVVSVYSYDMDKPSYIPHSLTKLKLTNTYTPTWNTTANTLTSHTGYTWKLKANAELQDISDANFDVVNAAQLELELRILSGLPASEEMHNNLNSASLDQTTANTYLPSQSRTTWYTLETVNDILLKSYTNWKEKHNKTETTITYALSDVDTWNFSSMAVGGNFDLVGNNTLPGHWRGAYTILFGTDTPDTTPWHMLGYATKPHWWDSVYSWTTGAKRVALLNALKIGKCTVAYANPTVDYVQRADFANFFWDWNTNCPVDETGTLVSPELILGTPGDIDKAKRFVFGDYAGLEFEWRTSGAGQAALIDAVTKLNPGRAFTSFYNPATTRKDIGNTYLNTADLGIYTAASNPVPGTVYGNSVTSVSFVSPDRLRTDARIEFTSETGAIDATVALGFQPETNAPADPDGVQKLYVTQMSLMNRGRGLVKEPAITSNFTSNQNVASTVTFNTTSVEYVGAGILQALYNLTIRNNINYNISDLHNNISTQQSMQLRGFTSKHLLDFKTLTYDDTNHTLGEDDFALEMYKSAPIDIAVASTIKVERVADGWKVSGQGYGRQEFKFFTPNATNSTTYNTVTVGNFDVKSYKKFAPVASTIEYDTVLAKIQDTYNFIRGYYAYLESIGFIFPYSGDSVALSFVKWSLGAKTAPFTSTLGTNLKFGPSHGVVEQLNTGVYQENSVARTDGSIIDVEQLIVGRTNGILALETTENTPIGSIGFVVVEHEHIALLNNKTSFGVEVHNDVKNTGQYKIAFRGLITDEWTGKKSAPGYLVFDNKIVENFDSSVQSIEDQYRSDTVNFNPAITKLEDITIGNSNNELTISSSEFDSITKRNYFQGLVKQRGTTSSVEKIERKFATDNMDINVHEQYMLARSHFGDTSKLNSTEFTLENNKLETSPQVIKFTAFNPGEPVFDDVLVYAPGDSRFVNAGNTTFTTKAIDVVDINNLTAGEVLDAEAKCKVASTSDISSAYDATADYALISTWTNLNSYKLGNKVRHRGELYQCAVANTSVVSATAEITISGATVNPKFPYNTIATIDGVSTTFTAIESALDDITATGNVASPTINPQGAVFSIDGTSVLFTNSEEVQIVTGPASIQGSVPGPTINDVTGARLTINSIVVDFDTTPADQTENFTGVDLGITPNNVVENFTGIDNGVTPSNVVENFIGNVLALQTYTISQVISGAGYNSVSVTIDGIANTDFTVSGQDITFATPTFAGGEVIVITLAHATVVDLQDTFTIAQALTGSTYSVGTVTINGTATSAYTVSGQGITFTTAPADSSAIVVTLLHDTVVNLKDTFIIAQDLGATPWQVAGATVGGAIASHTIVGQNITFATPPADGAAIVITLEHSPLSMTSAEIIDKINATMVANNIPNAVGSPNAIVASLEPTFNRLLIKFWGTSNVGVLTIATGPTNTQLGLSASESQAIVPTEIQLLPVNLNLTQIVTQINSANIPHITASADINNNLKLVSAGNRQTMAVAGTVLASFGLNAVYQATTSSSQVSTNTDDAISQINANLVAGGITGVTVSKTASNQLLIVSTNATLNIGPTDVFKTTAGISDTGVITQVVDDTQSNAFIPGEWTNISEKDESLFNIWVANDADYEIEVKGSIATKFYGWNMFQTQNSGLYSNDTVNGQTGVDGCGICAGTSTSDGNDAQVTTNKSHGLVKGDYVILHNTTTVPNIDGIHKVTRIGSTVEFYIDEYIDSCGSAVSIMPINTVRFASLEHRDAAMASTTWNVAPGTKVWTDYDKLRSVDTNNDGFDDNTGEPIEVRSTNVWTVGYNPTDGAAYTAGFLNLAEIATPGAITTAMGSIPIRQQLTRITNTDLDSITVYDHESNTPILELELYDPMRGIIPGVADAEIDVKSVHDVAIYNTATEEEYEIDLDNAWALEEEGTRWWDTSKVRYYDYDQGTLKDKSSFWAKQFTNSEVVIWEWTRSTVAPDDWASAVTGKKEMFGVVATGTAYFEFDKVKNQNEYYYTLRSEWSVTNSVYENVYYFWVRGKETIGSKNKNIITSEVENIITNPSANGIYWFSVADGDAIIISDIWKFVNKKVVVQLNKKVDNAHSNWVLLSKDVDVIPNYWYTGLRNNLAIIDENEQRIPDFNLHPYARYGEDRSKRQAWFDNIPGARTNALTVLNKLLLEINVYDDFKSLFNAAVTTNQIASHSYNWIDYVTEHYNPIDNYIHDVIDIASRDALNTDVYTTALIEMFDADGIDRTEFYKYTTTGWKLAKKKNATIEWNVKRLGVSYTWDMEPWDSTSYDNTLIAKWWKAIVQIHRDILFVNEHTNKFNKFFFEMIDYTLSRNKQVDWAMKTSYIRLEIKSKFLQKKKYKKDSVQVIENYINDVKPFHVKISETNRTYNTTESVTVGVTEDVKKAITIKAIGINPTNSIVYNGNALVDADVVSGGAHDTVFADVITGGTALQPELYNTTVEGTNRVTEVKVRPQETVMFTVQTNRTGSTVSNETRTFGYLIDVYGQHRTYGLPFTSSTVLSTPLTSASKIVDVANASMFDQYTDIIIVNNEVIHVDVIGNVVYIKQRGVSGSFEQDHAIGTRATDVTDYAVFYTNPPADRRFNDVGVTILDSLGSAEAVVLSDTGKGIVL